MLAFAINCSIKFLLAVYKIQYSFTTEELKELYTCTFDAGFPCLQDVYKMHLGKNYSNIQIKNVVRGK